MASTALGMCDSDIDLIHTADVTHLSCKFILAISSKSMKLLTTESPDAKAGSRESNHLTDSVLVCECPGSRGKFCHFDSLVPCAPFLVHDPLVDCNAPCVLLLLLVLHH